MRRQEAEKIYNIVHEAVAFVPVELARGRPGREGPSAPLRHEGPV